MGKSKWFSPYTVRASRRTYSAPTLVGAETQKHLHYGTEYVADSQNGLGSV